MGRKSRLERRCGGLSKEADRGIRSWGCGVRREMVGAISHLALGRKKIAVRIAENVYQCPLQLCLQLFQLSGDAGWIVLAFFLEGNNVEQGTDSTRVSVSPGEQIVCHAVFKIQGILGKNTLCSVKLPLYWQNKVGSQTRIVFPTGIVPWRFLSSSLAKAFFLHGRNTAETFACSCTSSWWCEGKKSQRSTSSTVFWSLPPWVQLENPCVCR